MQVQLYRGTSAQNDNYTGAEGELTVDTSKNTVRVHDGSTKGGHAVLTTAEAGGVVGSVSAHMVTSIDGQSGDISLTALLTELTATIQELSEAALTRYLPIGTIIAWPFATNPDYFSVWLECNGQTIASDKYPLLVSLLADETATEASVPNLQGAFLRGKSDALSVLAIQGDAMRQLYGRLPAGGAAGVGSAVNANLSGVFGTLSTRSKGFEVHAGKTSSQAVFDSSRTVPTADEFRPVNMAVRYLIRAAAKVL